jgi:hypothetical protein
MNQRNNINRHGKRPILDGIVDIVVIYVYGKSSKEFNLYHNMSECSNEKIEFAQKGNAAFSFFGRKIWRSNP